MLESYINRTRRSRSAVRFLEFKNVGKRKENGALVIKLRNYLCRIEWRLNQARRLLCQQKKIFVLIKPTAVPPRWHFILVARVIGADNAAKSALRFPSIARYFARFDPRAPMIPYTLTHSFFLYFIQFGFFYTKDFTSGALGIPLWLSFSLSCDFTFFF